MIFDYDYKIPGEPPKLPFVRRTADDEAGEIYALRLLHATFQIKLEPEINYILTVQLSLSQKLALWRWKLRNLYG